MTTDYQLQYMAHIFNLNGDHICDLALSDNRDAIIHVVDCINHTPGSKLRAAIVTKGNGHVQINKPIHVG